jgi:quercetin dioxygenase-like cupin family protein
MSNASFKPSRDHTWISAGRAGVDMVVLDMHASGGVSVLTRFAPGVRGGRHSHPGGEELLVISGRCTLDSVTLEAGDFVATPPGESHELVALEETVVFVRLPQLPVYEAA